MTSTTGWSPTCFISTSRARFPATTIWAMLPMGCSFRWEWGAEGGHAASTETTGQRPVVLTRRLRLAEIRTQTAGQVGRAELLQGLRLDLADALPGEAELVAYDGQGIHLAILEAEAQAEDASLPGGEGEEGAYHGGGLQLLGH